MCSGLKNFHLTSRLKLVLSEFLAHLWFSIFAIGAGMVFLWVIQSLLPKISPMSLFHNLHYAHIFFASATAAMIAARFSHKIFKSFLIGVFVPPFFCLASDVLLPHVGGLFLGVSMKLHICVFHNQFLILGLMTTGALIGIMLSLFKQSNVWILCVTSHFLHDFVSSAASLAYLSGFGFTTWKSNIVSVFFLMLFVVLIPCMISDVILPVLISADLKEKCGTTHCCSEKWPK